MMGVVGEVATAIVGVLLVVALFLAHVLLGAGLGLITGMILSWDWLGLGSAVVAGGNSLGLRITIQQLPLIGAFLGFIAGFFCSEPLFKYKHEG